MSESATQQLIELVYISRSIESLNEEDVSFILEGAHDKNAKNGISGMLIYFNGLFIQLLEGPRLNISQLYQSICHDARHYDLEIINVREITNRTFENWKLGYINSQQMKELGYRTIHFEEIGYEFSHQLIQEVAEKFNN